MPKYSMLEKVQMKAYYHYAKAAQAVPVQRDTYPQWTMEVTAIDDVAPMMRRFTLHSDGFTSFRRMGLDEYFALLLPQPGAALTMPDEDIMNIRRAVGEMDADKRPALRFYTVRAHRPEVGEIDVDIVLHGRSGPASTWALDATIGDVVGFRAGSGGYALPAVGEHHLIIADETALPALSSALDAADEALERGDWTIILEVPSKDYLPEQVVRDDVTVVFRGENAPGTAALQALRGLQPVPTRHAWICAEQNFVQEARKIAVDTWNINKRSIMFSGYWRLGHSRG